MGASEFSGEQLLKMMSAGEIPPPSMCETIPMRPVHVEAGRVVFSACASKQHLNPLGSVHGGFAATVLDSVTGCAVHSMLSPGQTMATIELNVKMMRPVPIGVELISEGKIINQSKSLGVSEGDIRDPQGRLIAHATATCMIKS